MTVTQDSLAATTFSIWQAFVTKCSIFILHRRASASQCIAFYILWQWEKLILWWYSLRYTYRTVSYELKRHNYMRSTIVFSFRSHNGDRWWTMNKVGIWNIRKIKIQSSRMSMRSGSKTILNNWMWKRNIDDHPSPILSRVWYEFHSRTHVRSSALLSFLSVCISFVLGLCQHTPYSPITSYFISETMKQHKSNHMIHDMSVVSPKIAVN